MTVRVFLIDGHPLFRAGVRAALESTGTLHVIGEADNGEQAMKLLPDFPDADVIVIDPHPLDTKGTEAVRQLTSEGSAPDESPYVLVVSSVGDDDAVIAALRASVRGYMLKNASRDELVRAVHTVAEGGAVFSPVVAARLGNYFSAVHGLPSRAAFPDLTAREREILDLLARGYDNRRIARELVLAEKTVRNYITRVFTKLQVTRRTEAIVRARDAGLGG